MARPRSALYRALPPNLVFDICNGQYRYKRVDNGTFHWMGRDKNKAIQAAKQLNSMYMMGQDLVAKVSGEFVTLQKFLEEHFVPKHLPARKLARQTLYEYSNKIVYIKNKLGKKPIQDIHVRDIADFLSSYTPTQANRYRSLLNLIFQYAIADGFAEDNPSTKTMNQRVEKKRRRLSLEEFYMIYNFEDPKRKNKKDNRQWLRNAMDLALLTLQRREDILRMKFSDIKTEIDKKTGEQIDYLYVIQRKTEKHGECAYIKIKIGPDLHKVIKRCRDDILSPFLIHRKADRKLKSKVKEHPTEVLRDFLSQTFAEIRDQLPQFKKLPVAERATFHEIRSLGVKLYEDSGVDAQRLAGHTNRKMTEKYKAGHEIVWTEAEATLTFQNIATIQ